MLPAEQPLLARFGLAGADLIGEGSESRVYALDAGRILRVIRGPRPDHSRLVGLQRFQEQIDGRLPFATPLIIEIAADASYTIERRIPGATMSDLLRRLRGEARVTAYRNYFLAVRAIGSIAFPEKPYGELLAAEPITAESWTGYLRRRLGRYVEQNAVPIAAEIGNVDALHAKALALLEAVGPAPPKVLVHGDYFPGNVILNERLEVAGVLDFSPYTVVGDAILDVAGACIFLEMNDAPPEDVAIVRDLVLECYGESVAPAIRFYRAYFAVAMADPAHVAGLYPKLFPWSLANLRALRDSALPF